METTVLSPTPTRVLTIAGAARDVAMQLAVDLAQWIGRPPFNSLLETLRSAQKSDFERLVTEREAAAVEASFSIFS